MPAIVAQDVANGAVVTSLPMFAPSSLNWTPATPTVSPAAAVTETVLETVAPLVGAVIATVGAVATVATTAAEVVRLPAASRATAVSV